MAGTDITDWKATIANTLPAGDGSVAVAVAGEARTVTVTIQWDDERGTQAYVGSDAEVTEAGPLSLIVRSQL
jgi:hypothetical protein